MLVSVVPQEGGKLEDRIMETRTEADLLASYNEVYSSLSVLQLQLQRSSTHLELSKVSLEVACLAARVDQFQAQCMKLLHEQGQDQGQEQEQGQEQGIRERLQWRLEHVLVKWEMIKSGVEGGYSRRDSKAGMCRCTVLHLNTWRCVYM